MIAVILASISILCGIVAMALALKLTVRRPRHTAANENDITEAVAAAIAENAGHNWESIMMPEYRAEFRRQAAAAIRVYRGITAPVGRPPK